MMQTGKPSKPGESSRDLAALAEDAIRAFREENPEPYQELVKVFEGKSADVALLGQGKFNISIHNGEVCIEPNVSRGGACTGRGAVAPETLMAIVEGKLTPLEAFFKGDLIARADSADLHQAYSYFVKFSDAALRSERLQEILNRFRSMCEG